MSWHNLFLNAVGGSCRARAIVYKWFFYQRVHVGYLVLLIPAAQELMYSRRIYVGCCTWDVIFGLACMRLIFGGNEMQEETCGNQRAESQVLKSEMENFQRVLCNIFYLMYWLSDKKEHIFFVLWLPEHLRNLEKWFSVCVCVLTIPLFPFEERAGSGFTVLR